MPIVSGIVVYFLVWWTVIFAMLPIGVKPPENFVPGAMPGAPGNPQLKKKAIWTTGISAIIWLIIYAIIKSNLISFRELAAGM